MYDFEKTLQKIKESERTKGLRDIYEDFISLSFITLFNQGVNKHIDKKKYEELEKEYKSIVSKYKKENVERFVKAFAKLVKLMEENPYEDFLGQAYLELKSSNEKKVLGQFFTPKEVVDFMVRSTFDSEKIKEKEIIRALDPCTGAGIFPLRAMKFLRDNNLPPWKIVWHAVEIDKYLAMISYINLTLFGIPAIVINEDIFRIPAQENGKGLDLSKVKNKWITIGFLLYPQLSKYYL